MKLRKVIDARHVACMGEKRNAYRILVGKPEEMRPLAKPRCRWEDNMMDPRETGWDDTDWICLAHNRDQWRALVKMVINLQVQKWSRVH
jgi:hypothetical protein